MPVTATYTVNSPVLGTEYIAPQAYWVIPDAGTQVKNTVQTFDANGNLKSTTITAYGRNITQNANQFFFTYTGTTCYTYSDNTNGSNVYAPAAKVTGTSVSQIRMFLTYTGRAYNQAPNAPSGMTPTGGAIQTTLTPTLQASFTDPDAGDTLYQYQIILNNAANGGGSQVWDSGIINASSAEIAAAKFTKVYNGAALSYGTTYSWKARVADDSGTWSAYSAWNNFATSQGPNAPGNLLPSGIQTSLTPSWSYAYTHPSAVNQQSYRYVITAAQGGAVVYDSGVVAHNIANNAAEGGTIPGGANLQYGLAYIFSVFATDTNAAQSPTATSAFSIAARPTVSPSSPIANTSVNSQTPTIAWSYADANGYAQTKYQIQAYNNSSGALLWDSGQVSSASASVVWAGSAISFGVTVRWHVQVWNSANIPSTVSADNYFQVINLPSATITAPTNGGTITNNAPTITWIYTASSTGNPQASATIILLDANNNQLTSYVQAGAGTSFNFPAGVLKHKVTYKVKVQVTDSGSLVGTSAANSFTLIYTPPADMQGQVLANGKNYIVNPYMNLDGNADGVADGFTAAQTNVAGWTYAYTVDANIAQPVDMPDGDGAFTGAQRIAVTSIPVAASSGRVQVYQETDITIAGWIANTTRLSAQAWVMVAASAGAPTATLRLQFLDSGHAVLSTQSAGVQSDTNGSVVRLLGPQNILVPTSTRYVRFFLEWTSTTDADRGSVWWMDAQVEAATASDAAFIGGNSGTGFSLDANSFSVRTLVAIGMPTLDSNPGADDDPIASNGGALTFTWDVTAADATRFTNYLIERRRQDQAGDDTAWVLLATITNKAVGSYTDYSAGSQVTYQYSIRQQIQFSDGSVGVSANRALVTGSVNFSPVWYLTNAEASIYNIRLKVLTPKRKLVWHEQAVYSSFLGRVGLARDAGPATGYQIDLVAYWNPTWGDDSDAVRRLFIQMQQLNLIWYLKSPTGLVVPVYLDDINLDEEDTWGDKLSAITWSFKQAMETSDY
jgi:hypothetical protein